MNPIWDTYGNKEGRIMVLTDFQNHHTRIDRMYIQYMAEVLPNPGDGQDDDVERYAKKFSATVCRIMKENFNVFY